MVESKENQEFAGIIEGMRKKLPMCHVSTSKQDSLLRQPFIGRAWVKDRVDAWLDNPDGTKICFVYGDPGIGKSAFAAHYTHYNGRVAASIFCDYNNTQFNHPKSVIQTLAFLLACRLPDYRISLMDALNHANDLGLYNESELFDLLLAQPLSVGTVDGNRETMCILIDGLDESGDRNVLTEVLTKYADRLPKWLRILTFSRKMEIITGLSGGADSIDLTCGQEENKADIRAYFDYCLSSRFGGDGNYTAMIDRLSENSGGIFLYATLMADALAKGKMRIEDTGLVPDGLDSAFYRWFQWFFPDIKEYEKNWQMPLACIAASPEPIPEDEIKIVWYDEYLVPGENFNDAIRSALEKGRLFVLVVTPSLLEKDNYVMLHEYPAAKESGKPILPAQMVKTDREKLEACYKEIPDSVDVRDGESWEQAAVRYFRELAITEKRDDPQHNFLIGLAYLDGIDVEVDSRKAEELIIGAANEGLTEAMEKLLAMYHGGKGVQRDYRRSAKRQERLVDALRAAWQESRQQADLQTYIIALWVLGDAYMDFRDLEAAGNAYTEMKAAAEIQTEEGDSRGLRNLSLSYNKSGDIEQALGNPEGAKRYFEKALEIREKLVRETKTAESLRDLSISYGRLCNIEQALGNPERAKRYYEKDLEICEKLAKEMKTLSSYDDLAVSYYKMGTLDENLDREYLTKAYEIWEKLAQSSPSMPGFAKRRDIVKRLLQG